MDGSNEKRASFKAMDVGTAEDWAIIGSHFPEFVGGLADRILKHLKILEGDYGGFPIDRYQHSLQTATRAHKDGRDEAYVVMALLHDIGDTLASLNHPDIAAAILKPFVSEELHWIVKNHGVFQGYYFFEYLGLDKNIRDQFAGHKHYDACKDFCALYDQTAFDPDYESLPIEFFEPMVKRLFAAPINSMYIAEDD